MSTPLPTSNRFFAPEISVVTFVPTIASAALAYTRIELDAGTNLTQEIADLSGWQLTGGEIPTPDLGSRFTSSIPGRQTADASSLTFYADLAGDDVRTVLTQGLNGFMIFMDGGDVPTQPSDVFPCRVNTVGKVRSVGDAAHQLTIGFTITRKPAADVPIPAAA
ncbi:hypothetical protein GXB85_04705 [Cellulomonas sp. APG4]|uniref:phage tail tube protein n=1 Tax=Cellulomonas sp. APG4 TaxID=1538656 RepID=UPI00137AADBF|nr:hypothetical protein [Cellulomonas sp. APG4]NCT90254.1 hypothetical protein [Cellulomonas sp. APG4]